MNLNIRNLVNYRVSMGHKSLKLQADCRTKTNRVMQWTNVNPDTSYAQNPEMAEGKTNSRI